MFRLYSMVWMLSSYFLWASHEVFGSKVLFCAEVCTVCKSSIEQSCCPSDAGDSGRRKAVPQSRIVWWGCTMRACLCGTSELRKTRSVLFWGSCSGSLVYDRIVFAFLEVLKSFADAVYQLTIPDFSSLCISWSRDISYFSCKHSIYYLF